MSPVRIGHTRTKGSVCLAMTAIARAMLPCEAFPNGLTVRIDRAAAFEPDALALGGARLVGDMIEISDPIVAVEVLSPSTRNYDAGAKLAGYFPVPSLWHYLMIDTDQRVVVHHRRDGGCDRDPHSWKWHAVPRRHGRGPIGCCAKPCPINMDLRSVRLPWSEICMIYLKSRRWRRCWFDMD